MPSYEGPKGCLLSAASVRQSKNVKKDYLIRFCSFVASLVLNPSAQTPAFRDSNPSSSYSQ
jgi:hypothetical protein